MLDKITEAKNIARQVLDENGLKDWNFTTRNLYNIAGATDHGKKEIEISKRLISVASKKDFMGVLLHETSHAILGPGFGHGEEFVKMCSMISGTDEYAVSSKNFLLQKYKYTCPRCEYSGGLNRNIRAFCPYCSCQFDVSVNKLDVIPW